MNDYVKAHQQPLNLLVEFFVQRHERVENEIDNGALHTLRAVNGGSLKKERDGCDVIPL